MRKELSQFLSIRILKDDDSSGATSEFIPVYADHALSFDEEPKTASGCILYEQSLRVVAPRVDVASFLPYCPGFNAVIQLSDCSQRYTWGNERVPVKVTLLPTLEKCVFEMECKSIRPVFGA